MKSLITKIIGACLGLSLATGVGVGIISNANEVTNPAYAATTTFTASNSGGMTTEQTAQTGTIDDVTITISKGVADGQIRIYKNETITIAVPTDYSISKIVFTCTADDTAKYGPGCFNSVNGYTYSGKIGTWEGSSQSVSLKAGSNQVRATSIAITYDANGSSLESISINGSLTKTSYVFGESWSREGLTLMGQYSDGTTKEVTSDVDWSYNPGCANIGVTSLTVTATVGDLTALYTDNITVSKIASPFVNGVPYKMFLHSTAKNADYYFIGAMGTGNQQYYGATTNDSSSTDIVNMYFEPNSDGQSLYFYAGNDTTTAKQYIRIVLSNGHINFTFGTTSSVFYYNGSTMTTYLSEKDSIYGMGTYDNFTTFGASASYMTSNYFAQFSLVNPLTAEDFATQFLDIVTCDSTGATAPTYKYNYTWDALNDIFNLLDSSEQDTLKTVDITGSGVVAEAMARYNYIVAKYGYTNFVNRTISNVSNRIMNINDNSEVTIVVISMIAIVMSSVLAFYFFKKKKFER